MSRFLDENYEVPELPSNYMKLEDGENKIRIMDKPVMGYEYWKTNKDKSRTPVRVRMGEPIPADEIEENETIKHFWAMPVYNYKDERIQLLEITQKSILKAIRILERSKDWGNPLEYDLLIVKEGQKLETKYTVQPVPPKKLDPAIIQLYKDMEINLEELFEGKDPFESEEA